MVYCGKCGAQISEDVKFCPSCGAEISVPEKQTDAQVQFEESYFNKTVDSTSQFEKNDIEQNKVMGILAYIGILVLVPIFAAPKSKFARFHANQGLVLLISEILYTVAYNILSVILYSIYWRLGFIVSLIGLFGIAFFVLAIMGIINAASGKAKELPIIGKFKVLK